MTGNRIPSALKKCLVCLWLTVVNATTQIRCVVSTPFIDFINLKGIICLSLLQNSKPELTVGRPVAIRMLSVLSANQNIGTS